MSDDRFKQARRSLIDRHNQRQQQGGGWDESFDGDDFEDEATAMVSLDGQQASFAPPPNFSADSGEMTDQRTEMVYLDQAAAPPLKRSHSGIRPSYDNFGQPSQPTYSPPATSPAHVLNAGPAAPSPNQSLVIGGGGDADFEGHTAFINLNAFAGGEQVAAPAPGESFTPDDSFAGYEGSTQFVNLAALQAGAPGATPVEQDAILQQNYRFGVESIQQGEFTLVFASNQAGQPVVLKRVWEGDPNGMPIPVRQRIAGLDRIRHPRLAVLNGMIAAPSGAWVELSRPGGSRLTDVLRRSGPQDPAIVANWVSQIAEVLAAIHAQAFVYANLTTDAVWVQDDGSVMLEPFDALTYEARGSLGAFGPPEMSVPPDQWQLSPATDVYCLAAVMVASLTGLPLDLRKIEGLDKKTQTAIRAALTQNPQQRPGSPEAFVGALAGKRVAGGGAAAPNKMRILIPAVALLGALGIGAAFLLKPAPPAPTPNEPIVGSPEVPDNNGAAAVTTGSNGAVAEAGGTNSEAAPAPAVGGDVVPDPRLTITTSFASNPPATDDTPSEEALEEASVFREEARELITDIATLKPAQQRERYASALNKLAQAVRATGGTMTAADVELSAELSKSPFVLEIQKDYFDRLDESLKEERISRVKQVYPQLAAVDAGAKATKFFVRNKAVDIETIEPIEE